MKNIYFPDEEISENDLYFVCYMIERVARKLKQRNKYVVNSIGKEKLKEYISLANVLHAKNPLEVEQELIDNYNMKDGDFDVTKVDNELASIIPSCTKIAKVYKRLIINVLQSDEDYIDALVRVYNSPLCEVIDNYSSSAFYEPSYEIARAYNAEGF